jgi:Cof subfamily protein (haloacid dehalogenase superfamily)
MKEDGSVLNLPSFTRRPDAIAIDIDGTLLDSKSKLSDRNVRAVMDCLAEGFPVIISTSRTERSIRRLLGDIIVNRCSLVMQNGSLGIGRPPLYGSFIEKIPQDIAYDIVAAVLRLEPDIRITAEIEGFEFGTNRPLDPAKLWEVNSAPPDMQLTIEEALKKNPAKFAFGGLERDISHVADMINERWGDSLSVVGEGRKTFLNVTVKSATKSNALRRLLETKNLSLQNTVAIGDDLPDYDMLAACGFAVAMGNAVPEIKAVCPYQTASNDKGGVAVVLETILNSKSLPFSSTYPKE